MAELSFIIGCGNDPSKAGKSIDSITASFQGSGDPEIILVCSSGEAALLSPYEKAHPDNILIVDCGSAVPEDFFETGLSYAKGACFWKMNAGDTVSGEGTDSLLFDPEMLDEDRFRYLRDKYRYIIQSEGDSGFPYADENAFPCLTDHRDDAGSIDLHYFFQDIYAAKKIRASGADHVFDIGSRLDGFLSHLLSMDIKVTMIDIRPLSHKVEGLDFVQGNATDLSGIRDGSIPVLSCLHALEHFGLGRYGDPVDHSGWKKALSHYSRVICRGGALYLSVPIGRREKVMFNAHRTFDPLTIVRALEGSMTLREFTYFHDGERITFDFSMNPDPEKRDRVFDHIRDHLLGDYDCGIFLFKKDGQP